MDVRSNRTMDSNNANLDINNEYCENDEESEHDEDTILESYNDEVPRPINTITASSSQDLRINTQRRLIKLIEKRPEIYVRSLRTSKEIGARTCMRAWKEISEELELSSK